MANEQDWEYLVNRVEIIDHTSTGSGRDFVKWEKFDFGVQFSHQDEGRTLKIFLAATPTNPNLLNNKEQG